MLLLLLACSNVPEETPAEVVPLVVAPVGSGVEEDDLLDLEDRVSKRMNALEERIGGLELRLLDLEAREPGGTAEEVGYDPSRTTLDAHHLQDAVDQLEERLRRLENKGDMGAPGEGLFKIPKDKPEEGPGPPQGGQGPANPPPKGGGGQPGGPPKR